MMTQLRQRMLEDVNRVFSIRAGDNMLQVVRWSLAERALYSRHEQFSARLCSRRTQTVEKAIAVIDPKTSA